MLLEYVHEVECKGGREEGGINFAKNSTFIQSNSMRAALVLFLVFVR